MIRYLVVFIAFIVLIIANHILINYSRSRKDKHYFLSYIFDIYQLNVRNSDWIIEKCTLFIISSYCQHIDLIGNFIKLQYKSPNFERSSNKKYNFKIDIYVLICALLEVLIYALSFIIPLSYNIQFVLCYIFAWRISIILFFKLNDVLLQNYKFSKYSNNRTILIFLINFIEIVIMYSFINSSACIRIFEKNSSTIFKTLNIFTNWSIDNIDSTCINQKIVIISQVTTFIILFLIFLTTFPNFKNLRDKKRN